MPITPITKICTLSSEKSINLTEHSKNAIIGKLNILSNYLKFYFMRSGIDIIFNFKDFPRQITFTATNLIRSALKAEFQDLFIKEHNLYSTRSGLSTCSTFNLGRSEGALQIRIDDLEQLFNEFLNLDYTEFDDLSDVGLEERLNRLLEQFNDHIVSLKSSGTRLIFATPSFSTQGTSWVEGVGNFLKEAVKPIGYSGSNILAELFNLFITDQRKKSEEREYCRNIINPILTGDYGVTTSIITLSSDDSASPLKKDSIKEKENEVINNSATNILNLRAKLQPLLDTLYQRTGAMWFFNQPAYIKYPVLAVVATTGVVTAGIGLHKISGGVLSHRLRELGNYFFRRDGQTMSIEPSASVASTSAELLVNDVPKIAARAAAKPITALYNGTRTPLKIATTEAVSRVKNN
jgi:hypothetical protein